MSVRKRKVENTRSSDKNKSKKSEVDLATLLESHPTLKVVETEYGEKIKSTLTGHELKSRLDILENFVSSKTYSRAVKGWYDDERFKKHEPYIVPNKKDSKKLFCTLTKISLNKIPEQVEKHVNGKKFKRLRKEMELKEAQTAKLKKAKEEALAKRNSNRNANRKTADDKRKDGFSVNKLENELTNVIESDDDDDNDVSMQETT
mmetsp:Transcript_13447/g.16710  ORF Transcript_13447/g.16710 Transcript_13447/m.16710 type:complete len:204 (-) Transcript_13447:1518-2129(-)|eukprot:CAMPEP_0204826760 /NCGR_PEP_ID=MMETSP1346-20131115/4383_1 /ASSEMBLY_ACC=CAM_ASM_000771 /TAXON_ID=215587 /ORGANISM="Aplanochytrium stocchinoi, Strain GSBS06" /LENGTH=203 /DNA_ID=CAMNT_0051954915 /DNA_START=151 /DNA_END=762 /DNA_ORIENTATION=-